MKIILFIMIVKIFRKCVESRKDGQKEEKGNRKKKKTKNCKV